MFIRLSISDWEFVNTFAGWFSAIGGTAAAVGAFWAAHVALKVARVPIEQQERTNLAKAAILAGLLRFEFAEARIRLGEIRESFKTAVASGNALNVGLAAQLADVHMLPTVFGLLEHLECFGPEDGAALALAAGYVLNTRIIVEDLRHFNPGATFDEMLLALNGPKVGIGIALQEIERAERILAKWAPDLRPALKELKAAGVL